MNLNDNLRMCRPTRPVLILCSCWSRFSSLELNLYMEW